MRERERERLAELEGRIRSLESEDEFGRFTGFDWWLCFVGAVVIPALALIWFRP